MQTKSHTLNMKPHTPETPYSWIKFGEISMSSEDSLSKTSKQKVTKYVCKQDCSIWILLSIKYTRIYGKMVDSRNGGNTQNERA